MAEALALQKMRMMMGFHGNGEQQWPQDTDRTASPSELDDAGMTLSPLRSRTPLTLCLRRSQRGIVGEGAPGRLHGASPAPRLSVSSPQQSAAA